MKNAFATEVMKVICEGDFINLKDREHCRANLCERVFAVTPAYVTYAISAAVFLAKKTFPTWRTNKDGTEYIGEFEETPSVAFRISYADLATKPSLFADIKFCPQKDYFERHHQNDSSVAKTAWKCGEEDHSDSASTSYNIIAFHCRICGVHVVKDGNHRLLQCAFHGLDPQLQVYEVVSADWKKCKVDMKNFCECIVGVSASP